MAEHGGTFAEFHATEVEPRRLHYEDMAGGKGHGFPEAHHAAMTGAGPGEEEPSDLERRTLRRVADEVPLSSFLVAVVELCERFTYYGLGAPLQNYIANSWHDSNGLPGAIGLKENGATGLGNFFQFWCYVTPILGAIVADQYLGKYHTILYFAMVYAVGVLILFLTSLPFAIEGGAALGGLIAAMILIGLGTGGIKCNVSPLIAEQYSQVKPYVKTTSSGEKVIVDPAITIQRIYMIFYLCINFGSLSALATTEMELHVGFWSAYLLCFAAFLMGLVVLILSKKTLHLKPPEGSVNPRAFRIIWISVRERNFDAARPDNNKTGEGVPWTDCFVDEVRRATIACKVFLFFPIYWLTFGQMLNNFVSQAGQMRLHGIPNDIMQNGDPLTIILFIPVCDRLVYPTLRRMGVTFKPITRITMGFLFGAAAMAYAAGVQRLIYASGPCYDAPGACAAALRPDGTYAPNNVHVAVQTPAYVLIGLSEIFASITGIEYAFTKAPQSMKSFIMSLFLLTNAVGAAVAAALSPLAVDPKLLWLYVGLAVASFISGCLFWLVFRRLNDTEEALNEMGRVGSDA